MNVTILGAGSMGTALGMVAARAGHSVRLWSIEPPVVEDINRHHHNRRSMGDYPLPKTFKATGTLSETLEGARVVILAVPSKALRSVATALRQLMPKRAIVVNTAKGFEEGSGLRMSEVIIDATKVAPGRIASLSGPSIAKEVAQGVPTGVVIASPSQSTIATARQALETAAFRIQASRDVIGVEVCGTIKNIYAIATGMCDGMKLSMNAKSLLLTVALGEMRSMVKCLGGDPQTVLTLAGAGDLIVTALSEHGRNRTLGERICTEEGCRFNIKRHGAETLEGISATKVMLAIAKEKQCPLPLASIVGKVLFQGHNPCVDLDRFLRAYRFQHPS